jgi:DNA-binding beta-propeller fold protein YncE
MKHTCWSVLAATITIAGVFAAPHGQTRTVSTMLGTGAPGYSPTQVNNPYGIVIGPDGALYFCDLDNQRIRRLDPKSGNVTTIAGNGEKGYSGDGGSATRAALNMPHEIQFDRSGDLYVAERDSHVIRKVAPRTGIISTAAHRRTNADAPQDRRHGRAGLWRRRWQGRGREAGRPEGSRLHVRSALDRRHREPCDSRVAPHQAVPTGRILQKSCHARPDAAYHRRR